MRQNNVLRTGGVSGGERWGRGAETEDSVKRIEAASPPLTILGALNGMVGFCLRQCWKVCSSAPIISLIIH